MKRLVLFFATAFMMTALTAHPAQAARFSGAYLYQLCSADAKGKEVVKGGHTACQAYIAGVLDYHTMLQSMKIAPNVNICIPDNVKISDLHAIVLRYLQTRKEHDAFVAAPAVTMALYQVYPCKSRKK